MNTLDPSKLRTDIEGLRGLAILAVVLFHSGFEFASGGYVGVDIFFVISGFLISNSILTNIELNKFSLHEFYLKRFLRLIPVTLTVILFSALVGIFVLFPEELKELSANIFYFLVLQGNIWSSESITYFGIDINSKPLFHLWSLAIELQFYIVIPFILFYIPKKILFLVVLFLLSVSFLYTTLNIINDSNYAYFSSFTRGWEFLLGVLIRVTNIREKGVKLNQSLRNYLNLLGVIFILSSISIFDSNSYFPGTRALVPCIGASIIIVFGLASKDIVLSSFFLRKIGLISFSLYLIHVPVLAYSRILLGRELVFLETLNALILSVFLAIVLYFFVEKKYRGEFGRKSIRLKLFCLTIFSLLLFYSFKGKDDGFSKQFQLSNKVKHFLSYRYDNNPRRKECRIDNKIIDPANACLYGDITLPSVAFWGDSHVDQIISSLVKPFELYGFSIKEFAVSGCPPIIDVESINAQRMCSENSKVILKYLKNTKNIKHVFLHAYWIGYLDDSLIYPTNSSNSDDLSSIKNSFKKVVKELIASGKKVYIIYPVPRMRVNPPLYVARRALFNVGELDPVVTLRQESYLFQASSSLRLLNEIVDKLPVKPIRISELLYNDEKNSYEALDGDIILYRDDNHLSVAGADKIASGIALQAFR